MTTETAPDPVIHDWSNDLEAELAEAGMEPPQAKAYARAFELGMNRVLSIMATKQELKDGLLLSRQELLQTKQELQAAIADVRDQLRREMGIRSKHLIIAMGVGFTILTGMMSAIIAIVA